MTNELTIEQALEQLREWKWMMSTGDVTNPLHRHNIETIDKAIQALEAQPKKGKWIVFRCGDTDTFKCSECGIRVINPYQYCHSCGAKMEVEDGE